MGSIRILNGKYKGAEFQVSDSEPLVIGRDVHECQLVFEASWVSRVHLKILYDEKRGCYLVTDLSLNGTYNNDGLRLPHKKEVPCKCGTLLRIGIEGVELVLL